MRPLIFAGLYLMLMTPCFSQTWHVYHDKQLVTPNAAKQSLSMSQDSSVISWNFKSTTDILLFVVNNKTLFTSKPGTDSSNQVLRRSDTSIKQTELTIYLKKKSDTGNGSPQAVLDFNWGPASTQPINPLTPTNTGGNGGSGNVTNQSQTLSVLYSQYYDNNVKNKVVKTDIGMKSNDDNYTIHIYFDQFGNSLYGSLPTGVSSKYHYVVHIIHPTVMSGVDDFIYSVNKTGGSLSDAPVYYNSNVSLKDVTGISNQNGPLPAVIVLDDTKNDLLPSSSNLSFDLMLTTISSGTPTSKKLNSYTITMTPYYFGAFDVGLIFSNLGNPSYALVNSPTTTGQQTVKVSNDGKNTFVSILYTVYWSPINAIFPKSSKNNNLTFNAFGRSYLDDNKSFLRNIYPCIGVSLNDQLLTNWFAGFNFEPAQGLGVFAGWNIRKVNTFDMPNFVTGQTAVTQDQFNYYSGTKLKAQFSFGLEVDISAFVKILGNLSNTH